MLGGFDQILSAVTTIYEGWSTAANPSVICGSGVCIKAIHCSQVSS